MAKVFYEVYSAGSALPVYDVDAHNKLATARTDLDNLSGTVTSHINDGDSHVTTADKANWDKVTEKVDTTDFEQYKTSAETELGKKLDKETFNSYTAAADVTPYSAGANIDITNHVVSGKSWQDEIDTAKEAASAAAVTNVESKFGYDSSGNIITYNESPFYTPDMTKYYTKEEANAAFLSANALNNYSGNWQSAAAAVETSADTWNSVTAKVDETNFEEYKTSAHQEFVEVSAWANSAFQPAGDYVDETAFNKLVDDVNGEFTEVASAINDLYDEKLDVSATEDWDIQPYVGDGTFIDVQGHTISFVGNIPTIPSIVGESGISATYDSSNNQYKVAISGYEDAAFAKFHTSANVCDGTSARIDGYGQDLNLNTNKVALSSDKIYVQPGLYHIDLQATLTVTAVDNQYYATTIKSLVGACVDTKCVDASFLHSETVDLSYDIKIADEDTVLDTSIEGFIGTVAINNVNIHEIIQMPSKVNGGGGNYMAGAGIGISNDTISVKIGDGLWVPVSSNNLEVKLGNGLTFTNDGGVQALTIDEKTEAVVATVEKLSEDLDSKVTVNMPFADVTTRHDGSTYFHEYNSGSACCIAQLFSVPINNKLYVSADGAKTATCISIMSNQSYNGKVIFGLFEYVYDAGGGNGDTNWVGDTGPVSWDGQGRHEFPLIHMAEGAELKAENVYYAVMCAPTDNIGNMWLAGTTTGYAPTFNTHPLMTFGFGNAKTKSGDGIDFTTTAGTLQNIAKSYNEAGHGNPRFFMQIRNKKIAGA